MIERIARVLAVMRVPAAAGCVQANERWSDYAGEAMTIFRSLQSEAATRHLAVAACRTHPANDC